MLEKNGARALLLWGGNPSVRFWKKKELSPMVVKEEAEIATTIDVEFMADSFIPAGGLETVAQNLLVLDVTEGMPNIENIDELCGQMLDDLQKNRLAEALAHFAQIK